MYHYNYDIQNNNKKNAFILSKKNIYSFGKLLDESVHAYPII